MLKYLRKKKYGGKKGQDNLVSFIDMPKFKIMSGILQKMIIRNTRNKKKKQCKASTHTIEQTDIENYLLLIDDRVSWWKQYVQY
jgi:hypothetical protein